VTVPAKHPQIIVTLKAEIAIVQVVNLKPLGEAVTSFAPPLRFGN
jgi:hypothetical protein